MSIPELTPEDHGTHSTGNPTVGAAGVPPAPKTFTIKVNGVLDTDRLFPVADQIEQRVSFYRHSMDKWDVLLFEEAIFLLNMCDDYFKQLDSDSPSPFTGKGPGDGACFATDLDQVLSDLRTLLVTKNASYGNSALDPVRIFSRADTVEQINVRIDDKLSRLQRGHEINEDTELDLLGYLILRRIAKKRQQA